MREARAQSNKHDNKGYNQQDGALLTETLTRDGKMQEKVGKINAAENVNGLTRKEESVISDTRPPNHHSILRGAAENKSWLFGILFVVAAYYITWQSAQTPSRGANPFADLGPPTKEELAPLYEAMRASIARTKERQAVLGPYVNTDFGQGRTSIHMAALEGNAKVIAALRDAGANVDTPNNDNVAPIHIAAERGDVEVIDALISASVNVDARLPDGRTAIFIAAQNGHAAAVRALRRGNADTPNLLNVAPIHVAVERGEVEVVRTLVGGGAKLNAQLPDGRTPVFIATQKGDAAVLSVLLTPIVARPWTMEDTKQMHKYSKKQSSDRELQIETNFWNEGNKRREEQRTQKLKELVDLRDLSNVAPIHIAAERGDVEVLQALIAANANVDAQLTDGRTPVVIAAERGHKEVVKVLEVARVEAAKRNMDRNRNGRYRHRFQTP